MKCLLCSLPDREKGQAYLALDFLISYVLKDERIMDNIKVYRINFKKDDNIKSIFSEILYEKPDIIGFSCYLWNFLDTIVLAKLLKKTIPEIKIILGGPEVSFISEKILFYFNFIDIIVRGEGELTFSEILLSLLIGKPSIENIKGISFIKNEKVFSTDDRELLENLDEIPSPLINLTSPSKEIALQFSRGCIYSCNYCTWPGNINFRSFSIDRIKEELRIAFSKKPDKIIIYDSAFNVPHNRLKTISKLLKNINKNIPVTIQCEVNFINEEQIECFRNLNIKYLEIGLQTANPDTLVIIRKNIEIKKFTENIKLLNRADDISYSIDLIWGLPGDNLIKFKNSIDFSYNILGSTSIILFHLLRILPGSFFWRYPEKYKIVFEHNPPHRVISNYSFSKSETRKASELVKRLTTENPWMKLFTCIDLNS